MNVSGRRVARVGAAGVVALGVIAFGAACSASDAVPSKATFAVLGEPQGPRDLAAIRSFKGSSQVDLRNARLLGTDRRGHHRLLTADSNQVCLVEIISPDVSSTACDSPEEIVRTGLWLKSGDDTGPAAEMEYALTVLIPDEYSDADIDATGQTVEREKNLLVISSARGQSDSVSFKSSRYRDLKITTSAG